ncbi:MAG: DUF805 domain-containing protein [Rubrivivax sp.]
MLASAEGRISRRRFWMWGVGAMLGLGIVLHGLLAVAGVRMGLAEQVVNVVLLWPAVAISIKRWHDRDRSGWWVLLALVPVIGWIWLLLANGLLRERGGRTGSGRLRRASWPFPSFTRAVAAEGTRWPWHSLEDPRAARWRYEPLRRPGGRMRCRSGRHRCGRAAASPCVLRPTLAVVAHVDPHGGVVITGVPPVEPANREWGLRPQAPPPPCKRHRAPPSTGTSVVRGRAACANGRRPHSRFAGQSLAAMVKTAPTGEDNVRIVRERGPENVRASRAPR